MSQDSAMVVGVCTIELQLPASNSLKDKRQILRPVTARLRRDFNVSVAEVGHQDSWQRATLGVACVSSEASYAHGLLEHAVRAIDNGRFDLVLLEYSIELV